jgi:C_GCAxxG_C_C family probable redox protein
VEGEEEFEDAVRRAKDRAAQLLAETWNCGYSPLVALAEALGLNLTEELVGASIAFAGGISGSGHVCGALWAAVAAVGAYARRRMAEEGRLPKARGPGFIRANSEIHELASRVYREFVRIFGSPNCGELNPRFDLVSPEQQRLCRALVRKAVEIALRVLRDRYGNEVIRRAGSAYDRP